MGIFNKLFPSDKQKIENHRLEKAIEEMNSKPNDNNLQILHREYLKSHLFIPAMSKQDSTPQLRTLSLTLDIQSAVFTTQKSSGELTWLSFTSLRAFQEWNQNGHDFILFTGQEICVAALKNNISCLFVSSGKSTGQILRPGIQALAEGSVFESLGEMNIYATRLSFEAAIRVGIPPDLSDKSVLVRLKLLLSKNALIEEVYLVQLQVEEGVPHLALGIKFAPISEQKMKIIIDGLSSDIQPLVGKGEFWDIIPLETNNDLSDKILKTKNKIYSSI